MKTSGTSLVFVVLSYNVIIALVKRILILSADTMIRNGDVELKAREEEIRFLKMEVTDSCENLLTLLSSALFTDAPDQS